jgi:hypothetical protein
MGTLLSRTACACGTRWWLSGAADHRQFSPAPALTHLVNPGRDGVRGHPRSRPKRQRGAEQVDPAFHAEPSDIR